MLLEEHLRRHVCKSARLTRHESRIALSIVFWNLPAEAEVCKLEMLQVPADQEVSHLDVSVQDRTRELVQKRECLAQLCAPSQG